PHIRTPLIGDGEIELRHECRVPETVLPDLAFQRERSPDVAVTLYRQALESRQVKDDHVRVVVTSALGGELARDRGGARIDIRVGVEKWVEEEQEQHPDLVSRRIKAASAIRR